MRCRSPLVRGSTVVLALAVAVLVALASMGPGVGGGVVAQDATPAPLPATPTAVECRVAPRAPVEIVASEASPEPWPQVRDEGGLPDGEPADEALVAAVTAVERELLACLNAGETPRALALLTDESVLRWLGVGSVGELVLGLPGYAAITLRAVRDVRRLPDGRVGAVVEWGLSREAGFQDQVLFHVYRRVGDRWLLDEEVTFAVPGTPTAGTGR